MNKIEMKWTRHSGSRLLVAIKVFFHSGLVADFHFSGYTGNRMVEDEACEVSTIFDVRRCVLLQTISNAEYVVHELESSAGAVGIAMRLDDPVTRNRGVERKVPLRHEARSRLFPRP
jgi:hypothetical protein